MIKLNAIDKHYPNGTHALKNITLHIKAGSICGIIGQSGAGKSTLLRCINLLERPDSGQVIVAKQDLTQLTPNALRAARRQLGMIFQHFNLLTSLTVYDNIALPLRLAGCTPAQIAAAVTPLLEITQLKEKAKAYPNTLSGGQKQRVAIARALANQPQVLLCDEATSALDTQTAASILDLLKTINTELGLTIVLITHTMDVVKAICEQVMVLQDGQITEQASITDFLSHPRTGLGQSFVKSCLKLDLPAALQQRLLSRPKPDSCPVMRIIFHGRAAAEPIIAELIERFHLRLSILQANLDFIQSHLLGIMLLEVQAKSIPVEQAIQHLKNKGLHVEIIGYVDRSFT